MMDSSLYLHMFLMIFCCFNLNVLTDSYSSAQPLCHEDERSALLQFKHSFHIKKFASGDPAAYPKTESWKLDGNTSDCCSWDSVECDHDSGRVIGLDLSSSFLYGSINSNSSLFSLVHLQRLNLAGNDFNYSQVPTGLEIIPSEFSSLPKLIFLDLSRHVYSYSTKSHLKLEKPSLRDLVQNLTNLKVLDLSGVNLSSTVSSALSNMTSLRCLSLINCLLHGEFPMGIFHLPNLWMLRLTLNENLFGYLPEFSRSSQLEELTIGGTSFSGMLPILIGNLESLKILELEYTNLYGMLPPSVGNLAQLTYLDVPYPSYLESYQNSLHCTLLNPILASESHPNYQSRPFRKSFIRHVPSSISQLKHLEVLDLSSNSLSGKVEVDIFQNLQNLTLLNLSGNKLTILARNSSNATFPKLSSIGLASCNLKEFPDFLQFQDELEFLNLANKGLVPTWLWNTSKETMSGIDLHGNFLTGIEQHPDAIPWISLRFLDFSFNWLQGPLPLPPPTIILPKQCSFRT
ncbi:receptor-like protein 6 [Rhododendron vialii]|uniref:receptor-like protein 6 n=1 Tax=Rhododendron vialii TaxID=182163 RepID=UPI00265F9146|nr:receptor-like protein 6 [Rhododendron vialii]